MIDSAAAPQPRLVEDDGVFDSRAAPAAAMRLAGLPLRLAPPLVWQPLLAAAMRIMRHRYPNVFERLADLGAAHLVVDPIDLPITFLLRLGPQGVSLTAINAEPIAPTATIRARMATLIDLLEGRIDGDALFFSRDLVIEGETEAVVALRNAVDDAEIDLAAEILSLLGPLAAPARRLIHDAASVLATLDARLPDAGRREHGP